jgi:hypothetical protein
VKQKPQAESRSDASDTKQQADSKNVRDTAQHKESNDQAHREAFREARSGSPGA